MAGKKKNVKGGLGKTARSSTVFDRSAGDKLTPHVCAECKKPIIVRDHQPVMIMPGRKMVHFHKACYVPIVPPGPIGRNDQALKKK